MVATFLELQRKLAALDDDDVLDRRAADQRIVGELLERDRATAAIAPVGGDQQLGPGVGDPVAERLRGVLLNTRILPSRMARHHCPERP